MVVGREQRPHVILLGLVPHLKAVGNDDNAPRPQYPKHLRSNLPPDAHRNLMEQVSARHNIKGGVLEGHVLGLALHVFRVSDLSPSHLLSELCKVVHVLPRFLQVVRGQIRGHGAHPRPVVLDEGVQSPRPTRHLEQIDLALLLDALAQRDKLADGHKPLPLHGILRPRKQSLRCVLVRLGTRGGHPSIGLPVKILEIVFWVLPQVPYQEIVIEPVLVVLEGVVNYHDTTSLLCCTPAQFLSDLQSPCFAHLTTVPGFHRQAQRVFERLLDVLQAELPMP
mmetsp:Transcript_23638/g.58437  ORF Transcript_23638/g.58437 Transcript_23638/m.58437 type:complete len:280 (-) Transcript_23638:1064-1903(-)